MEATIPPTNCVWMGEFETLPEGPWQVGWCFFGLGYYLSDHYKTNVAQLRKPITVMIPALLHWDDGRPDVLGCTVFCIDSHPTSDMKSHWDVTVAMESLVIGGRPDITVNPSIHAVGIWHGWLQGGVLHN